MSAPLMRAMVSVFWCISGLSAHPTVHSLSGLQFNSRYFRCGNFCYNGVLDLGCSHASVEAIPRIVPALQRQQAKFKYMHTIEKALKPGSPYFASVTELERATQFLTREVGELEELLVEAIEEVSFCFFHLRLPAQRHCCA